MSELKALESAYILGLVDDIATENLIFKKDDIAYKLDEWGKSKDMNILWVTGFSGSGKTTIAKKLKEKYPKAQVVYLDDFYCRWDKEDLTKTLPIEYPTLYPKIKDAVQRLQNDKTVSYHARMAALDLLIERLVAVSKEDFGKVQYIIEGIQIYEAIPFNLVKDQPMIIKGTSAFGSLVRRFNRNGYKYTVIDRGIGFTIKTLLDHICWYMRDDKMINKIRKDIEKESKSIEV